MNEVATSIRWVISMWFIDKGLRVAPDCELKALMMLSFVEHLKRLDAEMTKEIEDEKAQKNRHTSP